MDEQYNSGAGYAQTFVVGETDRRLARTANLFGLKRARTPIGNVREAIASYFGDTTLESARMHSVGSLAEDEHVDSCGTLHITLRRSGKLATDDMPEYGNLQELFQKPWKLDTLSEQEERDLRGHEEVLDILEGGSLAAAVFGIVKATIGSAVLFLPRGFQMSGYGVGIGALVVSTSSYLYSAGRLLECWRVEKQKMERIQELRALLEPELSTDYGSIISNKQVEEDAPAVLLTYPELARRAFGPLSVGVDIGVASMQFGVCLTYLIYVPQNLVESTRVLFGLDVDKTIFLVLMVAIEVPLAWIRDIRKLTSTNILATFLIAYGLASCLIISLSIMFHDPGSTFVERLTNLPATNDTWFLFVGTSVSGHRHSRFEFITGHCY